MSDITRKALLASAAILALSMAACSKSDDSAANANAAANSAAQSASDASQSATDAATASKPN